MTGLSTRNLGYMRTFADTWRDRSILQAPLAKLTWYHNLTLLEKLDSNDERVWYAQAAVENGWSRNSLVFHIEAGLHKRKGRALTNFRRVLPKEQSDLAQQLLKDPYNFDFLTLSDRALERDLEAGLTEHIQKFLIELGVGFAFVGQQFPLVVDGDEYNIDLLFYHLKLRRFVVIEIKMGAFKPEYAGKMNFYLAAVDDLLKRPTDKPSIGLILCKSRKKVAVEYALRGTRMPMGIAAFSHSGQVREALPTVEQLQQELNAAGQSPKRLPA